MRRATVVAAGVLAATFAVVAVTGSALGAARHAAGADATCVGRCLTARRPAPPPPPPRPVPPPAPRPTPPPPPPPPPPLKCGAASDSVEQHSWIFGTLAYRVSASLSYCYRNGRVESGSFGNGIEASDGSAHISITTVDSRANGDGSWTGYVQWKAENCVFHFACLSTEYPWIRIVAHGDGSADVSKGIG